MNELRVAGITTLEAANAYLREPFIPDYNREFSRLPADPASAFVPLGAALDLDQLLAEDGERLVGRDNVVSFEGLALQLAEQRGGGVARACASWCGGTSPASTPSGAARSAWAASMPKGARWTAPGLEPQSARRRPSAARRPSSENARAHLAQEAKFRRRPYREIPPLEAPPRRRRGPRLPVGPGTKRTDYVSKPSGHFIC